MVIGTVGSSTSGSKTILANNRQELFWHYQLLNDHFSYLTCLSFSFYQGQKLAMEHRTIMMFAKPLTQEFNSIGRMGQDFVVPGAKSIRSGCSMVVDLSENGIYSSHSQTVSPQRVGWLQCEIDAWKSARRRGSIVKTEQQQRKALQKALNNKDQSQFPKLAST